MCGLVCANVDVTDAMKHLAHRGLRSRVVTQADWQLGHVRLPIVGLGSEWDQPVRPVSSIALAFVGEILDFRERASGTKCDLDLVVKTWMTDGPQDYGRLGFSDFDGFWSIVAVHGHTNEVHALVDYLDQKPLYYRSDDHAIGIASEPDAVACLGPVTPDEVYFAAVQKWGYCPDTRRTPYAEVRKTAPGEHLVLGAEPGDVEHRIADALLPRYGDGPQALKREILAAVARRVSSSDVPVAALVSGGLDSSIVWTLATQYFRGAVWAFFADDGNEVEDQMAASILFDACKTKPFVVPWGDLKLSECLAWMQEPIDLGSLVPQCALSAAIGKWDHTAGPIHVCLTGDGADEMFGGYGRAERYDSQASDVFHELVAWHLPRLDRIMMKNRIEVRSPFLAREVSRIALGLPRSLRTNKLVLRDLFRDDLPKGLADQPKRPLRPKGMENGNQEREERSRELVQMFRRWTWPNGH